MRRDRWWLLGLLCSLLPLSIHAATFHVSQQAGNDSSPCGAGPRRTINAGIACLQGGDTLIVGDGTYDEQIGDSPGNANPGYTIVPVPSGRPDAFTTIKAATARGVTLRASLRGGSNPFVVMLGAATTHHVRLEGVVIDVEHKAAGMKECLTTEFSHDIHFVDLECKNAELGWSGNGNNIRFTRVFFHHIGGGREGGGRCTANGTPYPGMCHGLYAMYASGQNGPIIVEDSHFEEINGYGVHNYADTVVTNSCFARNWQGGIMAGGSMEAVGNTILESGTAGIAAGNGTTTLRQNRIAQVTGVVDPDSGPQIAGGIITAAHATVHDNVVLYVAAGGAYIAGASTSPALVSGNRCSVVGPGCAAVAAATEAPASCGTGPPPRPTPTPTKPPAPTHLRAVAVP